MTDLESIFAPQSLTDVQDRLDRIEKTGCRCVEGPHENALHDLAADDVPWLLAEVQRLRARECRLSQALAKIRVLLASCEVPGD